MEDRRVLLADVDAARKHKLIDSETSVAIAHVYAAGFDKLKAALGSHFVKAVGLKQFEAPQFYTWYAADIGIQNLRSQCAYNLGVQVATAKNVYAHALDHLDPAKNGRWAEEIGEKHGFEREDIDDARKSIYNRLQWFKKYKAERAPIEYGEIEDELEIILLLHEQKLGALIGEEKAEVFREAMRHIDDRVSLKVDGILGLVPEE
jgi:hypothetical protein